MQEYSLYTLPLVSLNCFIQDKSLSNQTLAFTQFPFSFSSYTVTLFSYILSDTFSAQFKHKVRKAYVYEKCSWYRIVLGAFPQRKGIGRQQRKHSSNKTSIWQVFLQFLCLSYPAVSIFLPHTTGVHIFLKKSALQYWYIGIS